MDKISKGITRLIQSVGDVASLLILFITALVTYEVVSRYAFNTPTSWVWLINKQIFGVFVMCAGSYALIHNNHIKIEMLHDRFPPALKTVIKWLSLIAATCFLGCLLWKSSVMGIQAWETKEKAMGVFKLPLYPLKIFMPVGAALFLLGCIVTTFNRKK